MKPKSAAISLLATLSLVPLAAGLDGTWTNPNGGSWSEPGSWLGGVIANGADFLADFSTLDLLADAEVTVDVPRPIGRLRFGDTDPSHDWRLSPGAAGVLELVKSSGSPVIEVLAGGFASLDVPIAGTQGFTKSGGGTLRLAEFNPYSGPTVINEGFVGLGGDDSLGEIPAVFEPGRITLDGGGLSAVGAAGTTGPRTIHANQGITLGVSGGALFVPAGGSLTVNSVISGMQSSRLAVSGGGEVVLNAANSFGGGSGGVAGVTVSSSTLRVGHSGALGDGLLTVNGNSVITASGISPVRVPNHVFTDTADSTTTFGDATGTGSLEFGMLLLSGSGTNRTINTLTNVTFAGLVGTADSLTEFRKTGPGTLTLESLEGSLNYTGGAHFIDGGTLLVNNESGFGLGTGGSVTVNPGGRLGGNGTISQPVSVAGGIVAPGTSVGSFAAGSTTFSDGSVFEFEMEAGATEPADLLRVNGTLNIVGLVALDLTGADGAWADGSKVTLIAYDDYSGGTFDGLPDNSIFTAGSNQWLIRYSDLTGGTNYESDQASASGFVTLTLVPEPSTGLLAMAGAAAAALRWRRRLQAAE